VLFLPKKIIQINKPKAITAGPRKDQKGPSEGDEQQYSKRIVPIKETRLSLVRRWETGDRESRRRSGIRGSDSGIRHQRGCGMLPMKK
jgi:hypothetical protein